MLNFVTTYGLKVQRKADQDTSKNNFNSENSTALLTSKNQSNYKTSKEWMARNMNRRHSLVVTANPKQRVKSSTYRLEKNPQNLNQKSGETLVGGHTSSNTQIRISKHYE